jgi:hypothetical protein
MDITQYYLNLEKIGRDSLDRKVKSDRIYALYNEMLHSYGDKSHVSISIFNTLYYSGYLTNIRDLKINSIIDEDRRGSD